MRWTPTYFVSRRGPNVFPGDDVLPESNFKMPAKNRLRQCWAPSIYCETQRFVFVNFWKAISRLQYAMLLYGLYFFLQRSLFSYRIEERFIPVFKVRRFYHLEFNFLLINIFVHYRGCFSLSTGIITIFHPFKEIYMLLSLTSHLLFYNGRRSFFFYAALLFRACKIEQSK